MFQKSKDVIAKFVDVGAMMEKRRTEIGMTIDSISLKLKVNKDIIAQVESGNIMNLIDKIYYEGLLSKYCSVVGLKFEQIMEYLGDDIVKIKEAQSKKFLHIKNDKKIKVHNASMKLIISICVICFSIIIINTIIKHKYNESRVAVLNLD